MIGAAGQPQATDIEQATIYIAWNIWKERCRRVYDNKAIPVPQLVQIIKSDIQSWHKPHFIWEE